MSKIRVLVIEDDRVALSLACDSVGLSTEMATRRVRAGEYGLFPSGDAFVDDGAPVSTLSASGTPTVAPCDVTMVGSFLPDEPKVALVCKLSVLPDGVFVGRFYNWTPKRAEQ